MRVLLNVEIDTAKGNELVASGQMEAVMQKILGKLHPEAAYFYPHNGHRAFTLVVDARDGASTPSFVEPFWTELRARVEAMPCMNADELAEGLARLS